VKSGRVDRRCHSFLRNGCQRHCSGCHSSDGADDNHIGVHGANIAEPGGCRTAFFDLRSRIVAPVAATVLAIGRSRGLARRHKATKAESIRSMFFVAVILRGFVSLCEPAPIVAGQGLDRNRFFYFPWPFPEAADFLLSRANCLVPSVIFRI